MPEGFEYRASLIQSATERALVELGRYLANGGYRFTTVTPETHRRVQARDRSGAYPLRDLFGWSRPVPIRDLSSEVIALMDQAGVLQTDGGAVKSTVRFSSLNDCLFLHSTYPTVQHDAVFFGPDTYRFARLISAELTARPLRIQSILDIGCGSGTGGIIAWRHLQAPASRLALSDINPRALTFSRVNAALNSVGEVHCLVSDVAARISGSFDLIVSNPPYMIDPAARAYRDGGGPLGASLSARILDEGLGLLNPGGRLVLYTGVAIVDGWDAFQDLAKRVVAKAGMTLRYQELDPDVFGEELDASAYSNVERIAVVGAVVDAIAP
jgi:SAM-dependent methyltransferase